MGVSARNRAPWVWAREATATAHPDYFSNMAADPVEYVMSVANEEPEVDPETADALTGMSSPAGVCPLSWLTQRRRLLRLWNACPCSCHPSTPR